MKGKLIGLTALAVATAVVLVARPSVERAIAGAGAAHQDEGAKDKDRDEDRDREKSRELQPKLTVSASKEAYDLSERIVLTLTLSLDERRHRTEHLPAEMTVETFEADTVSVVSATRNG